MLGDRWPRRVIPRWRDSIVTASTLEATPIELPSRATARPNLRPLLEERLAEWKDTPTFGGAVDLLAFDQFENLRPLLQEVAAYLLATSDPLPALLRDAARAVLEEQRASAISSQSTGQHGAPEIRSLRDRISLNPRNAIAYVDLARWYAALGKNSRAERLLSVANALEPNNRFIVRATARFHIHANEPDRALATINQARSVRSDPWLLASSVAISNLLGKPARLANHARKLVSGRVFRPNQIPELASALATLDMYSGSHKAARKLFNIALEDPNDNAVAQAIWASDYLGANIQVSKAWLDDPLSSEARYYKALHAGDLPASLTAAREWFEDEPYSSRPLIAASFIAGLMEDFSSAERYCRIGLTSDPHNVSLKNNLAFALTSSWRLEDSAAILREIIQQEGSSLTGHTVANVGQLMLREGHVEEGVRLYRQAMELLDRERLHSSSALAASYLARECMIANAPGKEELLAEARDLAAKHPSVGASIVLRGLTADTTQVLTPKPKLVRDQSWRYDRERNLLIVEKPRPFKE